MLSERHEVFSAWVPPIDVGLTMGALSPQSPAQSLDDTHLDLAEALPPKGRSDDPSPGAVFCATPDVRGGGAGGVRHASSTELK